MREQSDIGRQATRKRKLRKLGEALSTQVPMTPNERARLEAAASEAGVPIARLVRAALVNAGLLD